MTYRPAWRITITPSAIATLPTAPYRGYPEAVSAYPANDFGLVQMEGNVWQWTSDCRPAGADPCPAHTLRGGSFESTPRELRLANPFVRPADKVREDVGLRVVRDIDPDEGLHRERLTSGLQRQCAVRETNA